MSPTSRSSLEDAGLTFVAFPLRTDWETGETSSFRNQPLTFQFQPLELVRRLSPGLLPNEAGARTLPELLLFAMGIVGLVFLVMYAFALLLGLLLARSITRGVHELSVGTEHLRNGDFAHTIPIRSRDQLGELAESFNLMSRGIQDLLREQAEKERLEEELRIARRDPDEPAPGQDPVHRSRDAGGGPVHPGDRGGRRLLRRAALSPTRAWASWWPTSPARAPRPRSTWPSSRAWSCRCRASTTRRRVCSIEANRILAENMDSRTFVTMTYAVVDTATRTMRFARAGHNPLIHLEATSGTTHVLTPPGLGLGLDRGERFERILEEQEVPLDARGLLPVLHRRAVGGHERGVRAVRRGPAAPDPRAERGDELRAAARADPRGGRALRGRRRSPRRPHDGGAEGGRRRDGA